MAGEKIKSSVGTVKSEKRYLSDRLDVQGARTKLFNANSKLTQARRFFESVSTTSKNYQKYADEVKAAQAAYDEAKVELERVESIAKADYQKSFAKVEKKKAKEEGVKIDKQIESARIQLQRLKDSGQSTAQQEAVIQDLLDKKNKVGKYAPVTKDEVTGDQGASGKPTTDYVALINDAPRYIKNLDVKARRELSELLKRSNFYKGPIVDIYTDDLVEAYQTALASNQARSTALGEDISWGQFITDKIQEATALGLGGNGLAKPTGTVSISTDSEAAARVEKIFLAELKRLPTPEEVQKYSADLIAEEKKKSSITKATQKKIGGVLVTEYTGGIDKDQFLEERIRKLPEYSEAKKAASTLTTQSLQSTALANGLDLNANFGAEVVAGWVNRVQNGEDIDIFNNLIRKTAAVGLPDNLVKLVDSGVNLDAIYAPYKRTMANILEIPLDTITLDDSVLRGAIGPDGPMTIFDFQKQLRKDARWQYTDQAREEVSSAALKVLRDFGFQGQ